MYFTFIGYTSIVFYNIVNNFEHDVNINSHEDRAIVYYTFHLFMAFITAQNNNYHLILLKPNIINETFNTSEHYDRVSFFCGAPCRRNIEVKRRPLDDDTEK